MDAYNHQDTPFEKLIQELQPQRDLSRSPLFQVWFNMLAETQAMELPHLQIEQIRRDESEAKFDLTFYIRERPEGIHLTAVYNALLFTSERIEVMLEQYQLLLAQVVEESTRTIQSYSLHSQSQQVYLPDPSQPLSKQWHQAVHDRFTQQAGVTPDQLAVVGPGGTFTYEELECLSNQLAHYLLTQKVLWFWIQPIRWHGCCPIVNKPSRASCLEWMEQIICLKN